jgi:hypothetical protein
VNEEDKNMHTYSINDAAAFSKLKFRSVFEMLCLLADYAQFYLWNWAIVENCATD